KYLSGEKEALEILIRRYLKPVYGFVYKYTGGVSETEDISQDVFIKVWKNLKKFDQVKNFKTWLFTIAKNTTLDFLRKKKMIPFSEFDLEDGSNFLADTIADESLSSEELFEKGERRSVLASALKKLSPEYQAVVASHHENDFTFQQISNTLGQSINTVKSRYRRALIALKKSISKD
ncbi:MAG: RNA polymerase, sigma-24 subunit, ECF subfamily, partial [Parcubacteria group bacterium GW2011_GWB2_40_8]